MTLKLNVIVLSIEKIDQKFLNLHGQIGSRYWMKKSSIILQKIEILN